MGNYRAYIFGDLLKRYLTYKGYSVKHIMNITDVDDKTIRDSQKEHKSLKEFTVFYSEEFFDDLRKLNILPADVFPRATEHVTEMVMLIEKLLKKGYAYKGEDGSIYFNVHKFDNYGKLSGIKLSELQEDASGRIKNDEYDKENAHDFALWKAWDEADGDVFWETPFGKGRPGWHIECSAMSSKYLGETFDIHTGGVDLVFPHHENEIAQSECGSGKPFVKYWLHNEWLLVEGKKMSKSLGNFYTLRDLFLKGYTSKAIRYVLLSSHYRQQMNFTFEGLKSAESVISRFKEFILKLEEPHDGISAAAERIIVRAKEKFIDAMDDDLNISEALACIFDLMKDINKLMASQELSRSDAEKVLDAMHDFDSVIGIGLKDFKEEIESIPQEILDLALERQEARKNKDFKRSDELRDLLKSRGYNVDDTAQGCRVKSI
jgi:cysteinyl-tRNA synthetase